MKIEFDALKVLEVKMISWIIYIIMDYQCFIINLLFKVIYIYIYIFFNIPTLC